jgi:hypothetical protein
MRKCAAPAAQTPRSFQLENVIETAEYPCLASKTKPPVERMSEFRASWLGSGPAENHPLRGFVAISQTDAALTRAALPAARDRRPCGVGERLVTGQPPKKSERIDLPGQIRHAVARRRTDG